MAEEGTFCVNADVVKKAGTNANATSIGEAYTNNFILQAEARVMTSIRYDYKSNYSGLNAETKGLLREATSNLAAIYAIIWDMSGFTSRIEAEDMINVLTYNFKQCMDILKDEKLVKYSSSTTTTVTDITTMKLDLTAGEALVNGDIGYLKSDGKVWKTDADAAATSVGLIVMATETVGADATSAFLIRGSNTVAGHGFSTGDELFIGTTAGAMQNTPPSGSTDIIRLVGYVINSSTIFFDPDRTYIELT